MKFLTHDARGEVAGGQATDVRQDNPEPLSAREEMAQCASSPEVAAFNTLAEIQLYGSGDKTLADPVSGEHLASPDNPYIGKLEVIREDPKYGAEQSTRDAAARQYAKEINNLTKEGFEPSQAKLIQDLRETDKNGYIELVSSLICHGNGMDVQKADKKAKALYRHKDQKRLQLIKEHGVFSEEDYDNVKAGRKSNTAVDVKAKTSAVDRFTPAPEPTQNDKHAQAVREADTPKLDTADKASVVADSELDDDDDFADALALPDVLDDGENDEDLLSRSGDVPVDVADEDGEAIVAEPDDKSSEKFKQKIQNAGQLLGKRLQALGERAGNVQEWSSEHFKNLRERVSDWGDKTILEHMRNHPKAVEIALGAAAICMVLDNAQVGQISSLPEQNEELQAEEESQLVSDRQDLDSVMLVSMQEPPSAEEEGREQPEEAATPENDNPFIEDVSTQYGLRAGHLQHTSTFYQVEVMPGETTDNYGAISENILRDYCEREPLESEVATLKNMIDRGDIQSGESLHIRKEHLQNLCPEYSTLLDTITEHESGGNYNAYYGNAHNESIDFTSMSVAEVLEWQKNYVNKGSPSSAVGKGQFIRSTLAGLVEGMNIDKTQPFNEELQDTLMVALLERRGLRSYMEGEISAEDFANNLSMEWAALPKAIGSNPYESYYAGDGLNRAHTSVEKIMQGIASLHEQEAEEVQVAQAEPNDRVSESEDQLASTATDGGGASDQAKAGVSEEIASGENNTSEEADPGPSRASGPEQVDATGNTDNKNGRGVASRERKQNSTDATEVTANDDDTSVAAVFGRAATASATRGTLNSTATAPSSRSEADSDNPFMNESDKDKDGVQAQPAAEAQAQEQPAAETESAEAERVENQDVGETSNDVVIEKYPTPLPPSVAGESIDPKGITLHWWGDSHNGNIDSLANTLRNRGLAVQFGVTENGEIYQMTENETDYAWHARGANQTTFGIEIEGKPEHFGSAGIEAYPEKFEAVVALVRYLSDKYNIPTDPMEAVCGNVSGIHPHHSYNKCPKTKTKLDLDHDYFDAVMEEVR